MRPEVLEPLLFAQDMDQIDDSKALLSDLAHCLAPLGVVSISLNLIHQLGCDGGPRALMEHGWAGWAHTYVASDFILKDPAVRMLHVEFKPFTWSESLARFPSKAARHVLDTCFHETGFKEGLVVPVRSKDGALLTAAFCGHALDLAPDARFAMSTSGYHLAMRSHSLTAHSPLTSCPLTARQLACLQGVSKGHSDAEIAAGLRISRHTVHNHVEEAKRRLGVSRRARAAAEATRLGWLL